MEDLNYPSQQEAFDAWYEMPLALRAMLVELENIDRAYSGDYLNEGFQDAAEAVAKKYKVDFTHPKYRKPLAVVSSESPTVH